MPSASLLPRAATHAAPSTLFAPAQRAVSFPIQHVVIDWDRLIAKRPLVLATVDAMPSYLLKPEALALIHSEPDPRYRLIMDLMWTTGGRVSEVLALTPQDFFDDGYDFGVFFKSLKQTLSRHSKSAPSHPKKRFVPIADERLKERVQSYLWAGQFQKDEKLFPYVRQTVTRRIHKLVERAGGAPFNTTAHTFRHSFAIHLLLHGRPLKIVSQLLGHRSIESTEIYTHVLTVDGAHFLDGVDFH